MPRGFAAIFLGETPNSLGGSDELPEGANIVDDLAVVVPPPDDTEFADNDSSTSDVPPSDNDDGDGAAVADGEAAELLAEDARRRTEEEHARKQQADQAAALVTECQNEAVEATIAAESATAEVESRQRDLDEHEREGCRLKRRVTEMEEALEVTRAGLNLARSTQEGCQVILIDANAELTEAQGHDALHGSGGGGGGDDVPEVAAAAVKRALDAASLAVAAKQQVAWLAAVHDAQNPQDAPHSAAWAAKVELATATRQQRELVSAYGAQHGATCRRVARSAAVNKADLAQTQLETQAAIVDGIQSRFDKEANELLALQLEVTDVQLRIIETREDLRDAEAAAADAKRRSRATLAAMANAEQTFEILRREAGGCGRHRRVQRA